MTHVSVVVVVVTHSLLFRPILFCMIPTNIIGFFSMHAERFCDLNLFFQELTDNMSQSLSNKNKTLRDSMIILTMKKISFQELTDNMS